MTQEAKEKMDKEAFRLYPTFVQDREIYRKGFSTGYDYATEELEITRQQVIDKAVQFLENTDFCKFYNKEFVNEFRRKMEE